MSINSKRTVAQSALVVAALVFTGTALAAPLEAVLQRNPGCMCCEQYAAVLNDKGYATQVVNSDDLAVFNEKHGVAPALASCHTTLIGRYVIVGHVPEAAVAKLLREQPDIKGIALPGMPVGSPGMPGQQQGPLVVRTLSGNVYATF